MSHRIKQLIELLPKAELHLHIEGTLEPELVFELAKKNNVTLKYPSVEALKKAYQFHNLQEFLDAYYAGMSVLQEEANFYALCLAYLTRAHDNNVVHAEIFFDIQAHLERGVSVDTVMNGLLKATAYAEQQWGMRAKLILSFLRHLDEDSAFEALHAMEPYLDTVIAVGLDSSELGHPPTKFATLFAQCQAKGLPIVIHAGEEGPPEYIRQALDLGAKRIDHGIRCAEDEALMAKLSAEQIPLTVCPLSNVKLHAIPNMRNPLYEKMLAHDLCITINSDDPAYFGGYVNQNLIEFSAAYDLDHATILKLVQNSVKASFLPEQAKKQILDQQNAVYREWLSTQ